MPREKLDFILQICKDALETIEHWDGRRLDKDQLEALIAGLEFDLELVESLLKDLRKDL